MKSRLVALLLLFALASRAADYKSALPGYRYQFPRDHFDHPDYQTEWWYYTGNLKASDGHRFGFELTFFRQGVSRDANQSIWRIHDLYMAHLALSDLGGHRYYHDERINRAGPGLAGIDQRTGIIWNGNWQVQLTEAAQNLRGVDENFRIELNLAPAKPPVIHGRDGISRKAEGAGHASHYISFTRLVTTGTIQLHGTTYQVQGASWMDHEFFSESTDPGEIGWDWLSLRFDNNTELMLYRLRHKDGSVDPYSSGSFIDAQGNCHFLSLQDFSMTPAAETWISPETAGIYPIRWHVAVPGLHLQADITTPLANQELSGSVGPAYWEGAIDISGQQSGHSLSGVGYLEMTGYAADSQWTLNSVEPAVIP
jgi:predicted secreted hydrolase